VSRSEPRTGATISESPSKVRIWFDGPVETMFATISVEGPDQRRVDKGNGRVNPRDQRLLEVDLPPLAHGRYRVSWSVIARDGHSREGSFSFLLK
jgi:methionine-rich copper-binding protein CopC